MARHWPARQPASRRSGRRRTGSASRRRRPGKIGHPAVEHQVHVDDRRGAEPVDGGQHAVGHQGRGHLGRGGHDHRVGRESGSSVATATARAAVGRAAETALDPVTRARTSTPAADRARRAVLAVQLARAALGPADVAAVGAVEQAGPEDLDRQGQRRLGGGHVDRRQRDQVPEALDGRVALAVTGQPRAEGHAVERGVVGIEAAQGERRRAPARPARRGQVPVAGQRAGQVEGRGQAGAGDRRGDPARGPARARRGGAGAYTWPVAPMRSRKPR